MLLRIAGMLLTLAISTCLAILTAPVQPTIPEEYAYVEPVVEEIDESQLPLSGNRPNYFMFYQESNSGPVGSPHVRRNNVYLTSVSESGEISVWHEWRNTMNAPFGSRGFLLNTGYVLLSGTLVKESRLYGGDPEKTDGSGYAGDSDGVELGFTEGVHGALRIIDVDGGLAWEHVGCFAEVDGETQTIGARAQLSKDSGTECLHHDVFPMENGNLLVTAYKRYSHEDLKEKGYRWWPNAEQPYVLLDVIYEIRPYYGSSVGNCPTGERWCTKEVWRWEVADHLGDFIPGKISLNNINIDSQSRSLGERVDRPIDQSLITSIEHDPKRDEILITSTGFNEVWVIDHSISTASALGKSGDLIYRWGNPQNYSRTAIRNSEPAQLAQIVDATWGRSSRSLVLYGNIGLANSTGANTDVASAFGAEVIEVPLPLSSSGRYKLDRDLFGPATAWSLYGPSRFSPTGSVARMADGDLMLGIAPRTFQKVTPRAQDENGLTISERIVWENAMPPTTACGNGTRASICGEIVDKMILPHDSIHITNLRRRLEKGGLMFLPKAPPSR